MPTVMAGVTVLREPGASRSASDCPPGVGVLDSGHGSLLTSVAGNRLLLLNVPVAVRLLDGRIFGKWLVLARLDRRWILCRYVGGPGIFVILPGNRLAHFWVPFS